MGATLDALHRLQLIEDKLRFVREQVESKRRTVQSRRQRLAKLEHEVADTHQAIQQAQAQSDRAELDRQTREAHVAKLREALNRTKSNKEYAAILTQLNTEKADMLKLEDEVLKVLSQVDEHRRAEAGLRASLADEQQHVAKVTEGAQAAADKLADELRSLEEERDEATALIPPSVLALFERACERHDGEAMAGIEKVHPKRAEYVCSGCNMSIPLEIINALQSRDEIQQCQTCSRILFLEATSAAHAR